jgi:hypothetical protein
MKVALCLSGKPRSYKAGYEYHKRNLLDHYDVDVFVHTWSDASSDALDFINDNYKIKSLVTSKVFDNENLKKYPDIHPDWPAKNVVHMFYSIFRSNLEKKTYELENGFTYDVVIKSRFDYALNRTLPLDSMEAGKVYVPEADEEVMVSDDSINWKLAKFIRFRAYDNDYLVYYIRRIFFIISFLGIN